MSFAALDVSPPEKHQQKPLKHLAPSVGRHTIMAIDEPTHVPYKEYEDVVDEPEDPEDEPQERPARGRYGQFVRPV